MFKSRVQVLIEEIKDNTSIGHTSNYLKVTIPKILEKNQIYEVQYYSEPLEEVK